MYLAFSAAALPLAWAGLSNVFYYRAHPDMLGARDAALEVGTILAALPWVGVGLLIAVGLALYVLRVGPCAARINSIILVTAWLAAFLSPDTPFRSFQRLYWDALPFAALVLLPWACAAVRHPTLKQPIPSDVP